MFICCAVSIQKRDFHRSLAVISLRIPWAHRRFWWGNVRIFLFSPTLSEGYNTEEKSSHAMHFTLHMRTDIRSSQDA